MTQVTENLCALSAHARAICVCMTVVCKDLLQNHMVNGCFILCGVSMGRGTKVYINDPCYMTMIAATPIYGKMCY